MSDNLLVVGLQWGDEGKGKIIDILSDDYDAIVRFQGGANAGHTVQVGDETFILHLIPSGILREGKLCVIGNGVVVDPECLIGEIEDLRDRGVAVEKNLAVSNRAHVVMPYHKMLDGLHEQTLGDGKIQTTKRGIGPCYSDMAARTGIRLGDFIRPGVFRARLEQELEFKNKILSSVYGAEALHLDELFEAYSHYAEKLKPYVCDTTTLLHEMVESGKSLLFEGAQGAMLDIHFGTYPYVTSSNVAAGGACVGTGLPPSQVNRVMGIVKAYCTRVGGGPFPTEQDNRIGRQLRERGNEYGSTTGRPRRCGWLDGVALRHGIRVNGAQSIALMVLDVLSGIEKVKICVEYRLHGDTTNIFPADIEALEQVEPVYEEFDGWEADITEVENIEDLPAETRAYIAAIEDIGGAQVDLISVGPKRRQLIHARQA
jgi:adenylosuccinate synthase